MKPLYFSPLLLMLYFSSMTYLLSQKIETIHPIQNEIVTTTSKNGIQYSEFVGITFEKTECLTEDQRFALDLENEYNKQILLQENPNLFSTISPEAVLLIEPFRPKSDFSSYGYHTLQNQVDHDFTPNNHLRDYNCGVRTYDWASGNHQGTDYILWPYPWLRMSENVMEVISAAAGIIVNKRDGYDDKNCENNGNPYWNGFVIEHSDGSRGIYMHFKKNTLNSKEIGDAVEVGEFLGIAGSSGSSTIPHLHFEVRKAGNILVDPYAGSCNEMNSESWWQNQEAYKVPRINELSTHSVGTLYDDCPNSEETYIKTNFTQGDSMFFRMFIRDISDGDSMNIKIIKPDQSIFYQWNWVNDWGVFYPTAYATFEFIVGSDWLDGIYKIEVEYAGRNYETLFGKNTELSMDENLISDLEIYPNPVNDILHFKTTKQIENVDVLGVDGRIYKKIKWNSNLNNQLNLSDLPSGVYILRIWIDGKTLTRKVLKK